MLVASPRNQPVRVWQSPVSSFSDSRLGHDYTMNCVPGTDSFPIRHWTGGLPSPECLQDSSRFQAMHEEYSGPQARANRFAHSGLRPQLARRQLVVDFANSGSRPVTHPIYVRLAQDFLRSTPARLRNVSTRVSNSWRFQQANRRFQVAGVRCLSRSNRQPSPLTFASESFHTVIRSDQPRTVNDLDRVLALPDSYQVCAFSIARSTRSRARRLRLFDIGLELGKTL